VSPATTAEIIEMLFRMWTRVGPRNLLYGVQIPHKKRHFCWGDVGISRMQPNTVPKIPRMLLTSVPIGRPQKQSSVRLNLPSETLLRCGLSLKFFDHLFIFASFLLSSVLTLTKIVSYSNTAVPCSRIRILLFFRFQNNMTFCVFF